jgi:murein DD-endopeptidase MepM/ murein hydrolase activator NlpD
MMAKRRFERFRPLCTYLAFCLLASCSSVPVSTASTDKADPPKRADPDIHAELSVSEIADGTLALITVHLGSNLAGKQVSGEFEGIDLPFYQDNDVFRAVLGVPLDHKLGPAAVKLKVGTDPEPHVSDLSFTVVSGNYPTSTETLKVDGRLVQPKNPKDLARIKRESAEINQAYGTITAKKYWSGPFMFPVKEANYTSSFGKRRVYNGVQTSPHTGLDLKASVGTPIHASAPGKVVLSKSLFFTGNTVILDHGYGVLTLYAHLSKLRVKKGGEVKAGQLVGLAGMTGRANGPHLHWTAIVQKQKVNPLGLTQVMR